MRLGPIALVLVALGSGACSLGDGEGEVHSDRLFVRSCWTGPFDLEPDFFAAVPYRRTLAIRVQHGGDIAEVSDGLSVLVDDIDRVRASLGQPLRVGEPPAVRSPNLPLVVDPDPPIVHMTLYLHSACHAENSALYSVRGTVTFHAIFDGDPNETDAHEKLTDAEFSDVEFADLHDEKLDASGARTIDDSLVTHARGYFRFYFQRGQPGQPFP